MQRFPAWFGLAAMVVMIACGPFFHMHSEEKDTHGLVIHSHLPEAVDDHGERFAFDHAPEVGHGQPIDFLLAKATPVHTMPFVAQAQFGFASRPVVQTFFLSIESPRAHDPPETLALIPRSPPV